MTQNKQVELKNCPFCKSDNCYVDKEEFEKDGVQPYTYTPRCGDCYACIESFTNEECAIKAWNNRPIEEQQQMVIEGYENTINNIKPYLTEKRITKHKWVKCIDKLIKHYARKT